MTWLPSSSIPAGIPYRARRHFVPDFKDGLELVEGDVVEVIDRDESVEWWIGLLNGKSGYVLPSDMEPLSGPCELFPSPKDSTSTAEPVDLLLNDTTPHQITDDMSLPATETAPYSASNTDPVAASLPSPPTTPLLVTPPIFDKGVKSPLTPTGSDVGRDRVLPTRVRALYDVVAVNEGDLSYKRGDIIEVEVRSTAEVWQGRIGDKTGDFRLDYTVEPILKERVRALWDYQPDTPEDLVLKLGDIIQVIGPSNMSKWWWYGWMEGQGIGTFPFNFVEPLENEFEDSDDEEAPNIIKQSLPKHFTKIRVLHDVEAKEKGMLSFKRGDILELVERQTPEKWIGRLKSQTGAFYLDNNVEPVMTDRVKALYSYSPKEPGELQFSSNDIITVIGPTDDSTWWWYGTVDGRFGMFPFNFVDIIPDQKKSDGSLDNWVENPTNSPPKKVRALFKFSSKDPQDLSFEKDDVIKLLESSDPVWWEGELNGRTGMFPRSFCEAITEETTAGGLSPSPTPVITTPGDMPNPMKDLHVLTPVTNGPRMREASSSTLNHRVQAIRSFEPSDSSEELKFYAGDIIEVIDMPKTTMWWRGRLNGKIGLFPSDFTVGTSEGHSNPVGLSPIAERSEGFSLHSATSESSGSLPGNLPWSPCFARALYDFTAEAPRELTFLKGDVIEILNRHHVDWWEGRLRDQIGNVPRNYLELVALPSASRTPTLAASSTTSTLNISDNWSNGRKPSSIILPLTEEPETISNVSQRQHTGSFTYPIEAKRVRALYPWDSGKPKELIIEKGDIIRVLARPLEHWWRGVLEKNYSAGLFPANLVEAVPDESPRISWSINSSKQRDEAAIALRSNIAKLRPLLDNFDCVAQDLADNIQIQNLFRDSCVLRRKIVRSLSEQSTSNDDLISLEASFEELRALYDRLLADSAAQHWEMTNSQGFMNVPKRMKEITTDRKASKGPLDVTSSLRAIGSAHSSIESSTLAVISMGGGGPQRRNTGGSIRNTQLPPTPSPIIKPATDDFQRYEGRLSGIELEIERARQVYNSDKSIRHSNPARQLPVSPATILSILRPGKNPRPSSGESILKKTIYKPSVEYQYVHVVHANQAPKRPR